MSLTCMFPLQLAQSNQQHSPDSEMSHMKEKLFWEHLVWKLDFFWGYLFKLFSQLIVICRSHRCGQLGTPPLEPTGLNLLMEINPNVTVSLINNRSYNPGHTKHVFKLLVSVCECRDKPCRGRSVHLSSVNTI